MIIIGREREKNYGYQNSSCLCMRMSNDYMIEKKIIITRENYNFLYENKTSNLKTF